ncbi:MAG: UDP-glucose 4-epimerase GalE [Gammaproteobacteria bacterium]|nr:MAG: UDP-glucose 4-epimerase GalE [Gammaproteobacteria bacterium]
MPAGASGLPEQTVAATGRRGSGQRTSKQGTSTVNKNVLVTGGAGYIGSHTSRQLIDAGYNVTVLDNLYSGHRWAIPDSATFVEGDIRDHDLVKNTLAERNIGSVVNFAGYIVVPESVENPIEYYYNNTVGAHNVMRCCEETGVDKFLFSSSAAVYGIPEELPAAETSPVAPINPYGMSKLMTEYMLSDLGATGRMNYIALRYFNVAGASLDGKLGQSTPEATHLIKVACEVATGKRDAITVFGDDYPTPDGSCIRDYIHVEDLARAHVLGLDYLMNGGKSQVLNCGYGHGYSVKEVLDTFQQANAIEINIKQGPRRAGDPPELIANADKIRKVLQWHPQHNDLGLICKTALEWEKKYLAMNSKKAQTI